jgi:hypothetical protein
MHCSMWRDAVAEEELRIPRGGGGAIAKEAIEVQWPARGWSADSVKSLSIANKSKISMTRTQSETS